MGVLLMYINVRSAEDTSSYPQRDGIPADILADTLNCSEVEYTDRCVAFFHALFDTLRSELVKLSASEGTPRKVIDAWSEKMCRLDSNNRAEFFKVLHRKYKKVSRNSANVPVSFLKILY